MNAMQEKTQQDHTLHSSNVFQLHLKSVGLRSFSGFELLDIYIYSSLPQMVLNVAQSI